MPELPEVEFARRSLERWFEGRTLVRAEGDPKVRTFRGAKMKDFTALEGKLLQAARRGKYLMLTFEGGRGLVGHLGMTGKFVRVPASAEVPWSRARFTLDSGEVVHFRDPRMFGRLEPVPADRLTKNKAIVALGRDPLVDGLTTDQLREAVGDSKQELKVALMDQGRLAGLGNIHAAEALYRAKLHPARDPRGLAPEEWQRLRDGITATLDYAFEIQQGLDEIEYVEEPGTENPFLVYGREGEACKQCGSAIRVIDQGGRTSYFCPGCQPAPKGSKAKVAKAAATVKRATAKARAGTKKR